MAFRSSMKASASTAGNLTATPPSVAAHDVLAGLFVSDSALGSVVITPPTGWEPSETIGLSGPDSHQGDWSYKKDATGTDSFQWNQNIGGAMAVINAAWSGRDNTTPLSAAVVPTSDTNANTTPVSASLNGITASAGDDLAAFKFGDQTVGADRWNWSNIAGFTEREDGVNEDWVSPIALDTKDNVSAGATGALATTLTRTSGSGNVGYGGFVIAFKAAAGGGVVNTKTASDAIVMSDAQAHSTYRNRLAGDVIALTDALIKSITGGVVLARTASDAIVIIDQGLRYALRYRIVTDSAVVTDAALRTRLVSRLASDSIIVIDSFIKSITGSGVVNTVVKTDIITFTDQATRLLLAVRQATDNVVMSDANVRSVLRNRLAADGIVVTDAQLHSALRMCTLFDSITVTDNVVKARWNTRLFADAIGVTDEAIAQYIPFLQYTVRAFPIIGMRDAIILGMTDPIVLGGY